MNFDINFVRGVITLLLFISFLGLCFWAYSRKREKAFNEAANLPFADEDLSIRSGSAANTSKSGEPS
jgi:cytochrome c oxidase cbb3-type subunit 4